MGHKLSSEKLAFSRVLSRDLGLWVCAAYYIRGVIENLAAYSAMWWHTTKLFMLNLHFYRKTELNISLQSIIFTITVTANNFEVI